MRQVVKTAVVGQGWRWPDKDVRRSETVAIFLTDVDYLLLDRRVQVCRSGTYLLDGACVQSCPSGLTSLGLGNFKRKLHGVFCLLVCG